MSELPPRGSVLRPSASKLIIVSNRLPFTVTVAKGQPEVRPSTGGLATGMRPLHERGDNLWIGWSGDLDGLSVDDAATVMKDIEARRFVPVPIPADERRVFYDELSNGVLWPICHDRLDQLPLDISGWDVYERVNRRFAEAAASCYQPGDTIWVHDYQLMRVPAMLREMLPDARIGFFLHVPFPNPEIFFALPPRRWLVEGILGADLIGFHTRRWRGHFTAALRRLLGLEMSPDETIHWNARRVRLGIHPMGVDAEQLAQLALSSEVNAERIRLRVGGQRLLVGVDRLDYSKGLLRRLSAFGELLRRYPEWHEKVRLIQVGVPSRGGIGSYDRFREEINSLVGRINGEFSTANWSPIRYLHRAIPDNLLVSLFRAADVMLVTPLRDGMNLVCKEFAACRIDEDGVLVLSEFAGAADELADAVIVNPYDTGMMADAMHQSLTMAGQERRRRMRALRKQVFANDVHRWASEFLRSLAGTIPSPTLAYAAPHAGSTTHSG
jgi:trehalose 6-phosphate synthase/phosphatase